MGSRRNTALKIGFLVAVVAVVAWFASKQPRSADFAETRSEPTGGVQRVAEAPQRGAPVDLSAERTATAVAPPARSESSSFATAVHVIATDGRAITGARIVRSDLEVAEAWREVGVTNDTGVLLLQLEAPGSVRVAASAPGFVTALADFSAPRTDPVVIELSAASSICGRVVCGNGGELPERLAVLALHSHCASDALTTFLQIESKDPRLPVAYSSNGGDFCIDGLRPGGAYTLVCAGNGYIQTNPWIPVRAGAENVSIEVAPLFGVRVRLRAAGERANGRTDFRDTDYSSGCEDPQARPVLPGLPAMLAASDPRIGVEEPDAKVLLCTSTCGARSVGPVWFRCAIPGYSEAQGACQAPLVSDGLADLSIELESLVAGFGVVDLELVYPGVDAGAEGGVGENQSARLGYPRGVLQLSGAEGVSYRFPVPPSDSSIQRLLSVPLGDYRARFTAYPAGVQYPSKSEAPLELRVEEHGSALRVELGGTGALQLAVTSPSGGGFAGDVRIGFSSKPNAEALNYRSHGVFAVQPPYRLSGLPQGLYRVTVLNPTLKGRVSGNASEVVEVRSGELRTVEWLTDE